MTDIELCNLALARLAIDPISSFEDGTLESSTCKRLYSQKRDAYLESFYWWFAKGQAVLNTLVDEPLFGKTPQAFWTPSGSPAGVGRPPRATGPRAGD